MDAIIFDESFFRLEEKRLCLDFANTVDWHASDNPQEMLNAYHDLVGWGKEVGLLTEASHQELLEEANRRPDSASETLRQAIDLREAIYHLFVSHLAGDPARDEDLQTLNRVLAKHTHRLRLRLGKEGFAWEWSGSDPGLDWLLGPIAQSAANLLASPELERMGMCADETGCGWLFFDTSRNHSRRWCDMQGCGNRAKARLHYSKKKAREKAE